MKSLIPLLQIDLTFTQYKFALFCFITAFVVAMVCIPPVIMLVNRFKLYDIPDNRKEHILPTPTMGGIAIMAGMSVSLALWYPFNFESNALTFFFCTAVLFGMGITDDLKDLSARYKFIVEIALASLIALSGIRITSFNGLFGLNEIPVGAQYTLTILAIVGITNAFNLIDGIDSLAGSLSFMSLVTLGIFLTITGEKGFALVAFALAGSVFAFLYFNMNPARIFMGDTGSLVLGFAIAILCIKLIQSNAITDQPLLKNAPLFVLGVVLIPVFDTIRVFSIRIWKGQSPFSADKTHIHHLLTNAGYSHNSAAKIISIVHAFILMEVYWLRDIKPELNLLLLLGSMFLVTVLFYNIRMFKRRSLINPKQEKYNLNRG